MTNFNHTFLMVVAFVVFIFGIWGYANQPIQEPSWPAKVPGFAFSPYQSGESPFKNRFPTSESISDDIRLLVGKTDALRTYSVNGVFAQIPALAAQQGMNVTLGAWVDGRLDENQRELDALVGVVQTSPQSIVNVIIGNEVLLREELEVEQLIAYLASVRSQVNVPVSTAEPWHVWIKNPELVEHVDFIAVHMLPYWEGIEMSQAVDYIVDKMRLLQHRFPNKPILIAEVGWPSYGRSIGDASASSSDQAIFLRRFIHRAQQEGYVYYLMEAFDQPWKEKLEGAVGAHWGVYDVERQPKFEFHNSIIHIPTWHLLAAASVLVAIVLVLLLLIDSATLNHRGRGFLVGLAFFAASVIVWIMYDYSLQYQSWISGLVGILLLLGVVGVLVVILAEAHEWAEALWYKARRRTMQAPIPSSTALPFVSIHVPAYNEPPQMMIETLNALAQLDYPDFEVLVIDNNTADPDVWQPVEAHCQLLGDRFRFFHVSPLAGFKAGALNFALARTDARAQAIAVIDSDYVVEPCWLKTLAIQLNHEDVAIVQAPQDYRDHQQNAFKAMCYAEYRGFFHIGMVTRNERNAIIQHGTMTIVRRSVLEAVGGWGESTITEDAELGLRIFEQGHQAVYIEQSFGKGLMPDTFNDYKKQRYRWAYGAMQILREHAKALLHWQDTKLQPGQRYHFIAGWLPWIADGFNLIFTFMAIIWSILMISDPRQFNAPQLVFSLIPIAFFVFKIVKMLMLYRGQVKTTLTTALAAAVAGLALSHTIAKAVLYGLFIGRKMPFLRTPKQADSAALVRALLDAREEVFIALTLLSLAVVIMVQVGLASQETQLWVLVLVVQSIPYLAAIALSVMSALPGVSANWVGVRANESACRTQVIAKELER